MERDRQRGAGAGIHTRDTHIFSLHTNYPPPQMPASKSIDGQRGDTVEKYFGDYNV